MLHAAGQLKQQGKLNEAVAWYRRALTSDPASADAHYLLGNTLIQQGKFDEAEAHYRRAVALNPHFAEAHNNLGNVLKRHSKLDEAATHYRRATILKPNFSDAHVNLGNALQDQGRADEAASQYRRALALNPDFAEAHSNLANALNRQGKLDEAMVEYRRALELKPGLSEAHNNLGTVLQARGKTAEAIAHYHRALSLAPECAGAYGNLGKALMDTGDTAQALKVIQRSIKIDGSANAKLLFVQCLRNMNFVPDGIDLRNDLIRALSEPWGRPSDLARFVAIYLRSRGSIRTSTNRVTGAWPKRLPPREIFSPAELSEIADDRLLCGVLEKTLVCDIELERFLISARQAILEAANDCCSSQPLEASILRFYCSLAQQCFINEYIFAQTNDEEEQATRLRELVIEALASKAPLPEIVLVAVAAFFPLSSIPGAEFLAERQWSAPVDQLVERHLRDRKREQQLMATMPRLTSIEDAVSIAVKQQYEENPYPRWEKAAPVGAPTTIDAYLRHKFPLIERRNFGNSNVEILVSGCGTGQHSIETARRFPEAKVLAIDLSLASLAYAKRKTRELKLNNIEYAQADIVQLPSSRRVFDIVEAVGVLHHLADPMAGWRALLSTLRPGGFMRLGLYSSLARQDLVAARTFIARRNYGSSTDEIRRCRQELLGLGRHDTALMKVSEWADFFSTSTCRDLLFHVQEHRLNLSEIGQFLDQNGLEFLGFDLPGEVLERFRRSFPNDKTLTNLALWDRFERDNPPTFVGMYQFWIRKK